MQHYHNTRYMHEYMHNLVDNELPTRECTDKESCEAEAIEIELIMPFFEINEKTHGKYNESDKWPWPIPPGENEEISPYPTGPRF